MAGESEEMVNLSDDQEYRREIELEAMEVDGTSSQGTQPLIRVREMDDLLTPTSSSPPVSSGSLTSSTPKSQGHSNGNRSISSMYPNSQKRKAPVKVKGSPIKASPVTARSVTTPSANRKQRAKKIKTEKNITPTIPTPSTSSSRKGTMEAKPATRGGPTAKNSGMKAGALLQFFVKSEGRGVATPSVQNTNSTLPPINKVKVDPEESPAQNQSLNPPSPPIDADIEIIEINDENEVDIPQPPPPPPPPVLPPPPELHIHRTPPKLCHETAQGVTSITIVPRPHAPQKGMSVQKMDRTPPHDEAEQPTAEAVRRQLFPQKARVPPKQKNQKKTRSRVEAYRRWQNGSGSEEVEEADNAKENEGSNPPSPIGDTNSATDEEGVKKQRGRPCRPKPTLQRRSSNYSSSDGAGSGGGGGKRKTVDLGSGFGIPVTLAKALKKQFGEGVKSGMAQEDRKVGFTDIEPLFLAHLLERCGWFTNIDTTKSSFLPVSKSEQHDTFEFFTKGIQSVLELSGGEASQRRARAIPHLLETFKILYENEGRPNPVNSYWEIFMDLFKRPVEQSRRRLKEEGTLRLFEGIVELTEVTYKEYLATEVKIHFPLVASLFQGPPTTNLNHKQNVIKNFKELITLLFSVEETSKESAILMTIFNLAVDFYDCRRVQFYCRAKEMLDALWEGIQQRQANGSMDWGLSLIKRIQRNSFGMNICKRIIIENLNDVEDLEMNQAAIDLLLKDIAQSPLVLEHVKKDYDHGRKEDRQDDNLKGETSFHRACALRPTLKMSTKIKWERSITNLRRLLDELFDPSMEIPPGDINAVDNNGNTPLADACQNGRQDAIKLIFDKCWNPRASPSRRNLDILAVDAHGNTLLHIALSSLKGKILGDGDPEVLEEKLKVVKFLVKMATQDRKKLQILFDSKNNMKETVFSFGVVGHPVWNECERFLRVNRSLAIQPFVTTSPVQPGDESLRKIQESRGLQRILAYWEYFYEGNF